MMKSSSYIHIAVQSLFFILVNITHSQQLCPPPDVPLYGDYYPKQNDFQPGDKVTYNCTGSYALMGKGTSKCKSNGDWSNLTPFCDLKAEIQSPFKVTRAGRFIPIPEIADGNTSTCSSFITGEHLVMTLDKPGSLYAVRLFLRRGEMNIEIVSGSSSCSGYNKYVDTSQWVLLQCNRNTPISTSVKVKDKSSKNINSTICEIEVFVKEDEGCDSPPDRRVANGYFQVTRNLAKLVCENGYQIDSGNDRLVCEKNIWVGSKLQCSEILCNPVINVPVAPGSEWKFLDNIMKISAGTRRQLICSDGYTISGGPDTVFCQKNGLWSNTNATCIEIAQAKTSTKAIIIGVVAGVVVLIIIVLFAVTIHFVRKQRREVVVVYKTPGDGSVYAGSEPEYATVYYESIKGTAPQPQPPTSSRPTAQMISENYFTPLDCHDLLKNQPTPVDLAFDYAVPYQPIGS